MKNRYTYFHYICRTKKLASNIKMEVAYNTKLDDQLAINFSRINNFV